MASTLLHEQGWTSDVIERQLAHAERNKVKAAYNRAGHLPERRKMTQAWAGYLDALKSGAKVIPMNRAERGESCQSSRFGIFSRCLRTTDSVWPGRVAVIASTNTQTSPV